MVLLIAVLVLAIAVGAVLFYRNNQKKIEDDVNQVKKL